MLDGDAAVVPAHGELTDGFDWLSHARVAAVEKAEAEKVQVVKAAEADAEAKYLAGQVHFPVPFD